MPSTTDTTGLGRLLDRAAGALGHTHPGLAAELTARATLAHEPPDPFDGLTGDATIDHYRTFGYLVLRGFFDPDLVAALGGEVRAALLAVHGEDRLGRPPPGGGMAVHEACLLGPWAPRTVDLVDGRALVGLAERLVGGAVLPSPADTQGKLYLDHAPWHNDTGILVRAVKLVAYLEPLDRATGALRVLPASHRLPDAAFAHLYSLDVDVPDVPAQVLATEPGDVIAFDPLLWHATWGGGERLQWSTLYVRDAVTPRGRDGLVEWFADGASDVATLPEGFRPFDPRWVAEGGMDADGCFDQRHRWMFRFHRLGVLDAYGVAASFTV
ncbi:MAG TPA: phytanoyl-CoA dioxygenase family protein [Acidimicrobiales bacterium]|nr:phytanoyl-CoA dioxygenase family protein [Acidimicrobiales bacterium]